MSNPNDVDPGRESGTGREELPPVELGVLRACLEVIEHNQELLPLLAEALGVPETEVFYTWAFRRCRQCIHFGDTDWVTFFHGLECDLRNERDGCFLRIDFGPGGRVDTFSSWGVLQYIMTATAPWTDYQWLRPHLAKGGPPYDRLSGDFLKMADVWDALEARGVFAPAEPALVRLTEQHTAIGEDGIRCVRYPPGTSDRTVIDCMVAGRTRLTPVGYSLLE